jgi:hypothetical protein
MTARKRSTMQEIQSFDEVPSFATEAEEAEYWATHCLGQPVLDRMGPLPEDLLPTRPRTRPVAVRFDEDVTRAKRL